MESPPSEKSGRCGYDSLTPAPASLTTSKPVLLGIHIFFLLFRSANLLRLRTLHRIMSNHMEYMCTVRWRRAEPILLGMLYFRLVRRAICCVC